MILINKNDSDEIDKIKSRENYKTECQNFLDKAEKLEKNCLWWIFKNL